MKRTPIGSRKWKEVTDFDLKVLSFIIIFFSIATILLTLYAFYLRFEKAKVDVIIRELTPEQSKVTQKITKTSTETTIVLQPAEESTALISLPEKNTQSTQNIQNIQNIQNEKTIKDDIPSTPTSTSNVTLKKLAETKEADAEAEANIKEQQLTEQTKAALSTKDKVEENKYLKELTKFDYNLIVARMSENFNQSVLNSLYLYSVDSTNALKIAKSTQHYVIDQAGNGKYNVLTISNVAPDLSPSTFAYTIMTDPIKDSKEAFKSVVNFRALGISSFSISTSNGYVICLGIFASETKGKNFYYAQDWAELSKYGFVKGAKVVKIGK